MLNNGWCNILHWNAHFCHNRYIVARDGLSINLSCNKLGRNRRGHNRRGHNIFTRNRLRHNSCGVCPKIERLCIQIVRLNRLGFHRVFFRCVNGRCFACFNRGCLRDANLTIAWWRDIERFGEWLFYEQVCD